MQQVAQEEPGNGHCHDPWSLATVGTGESALQNVRVTSAMSPDRSFGLQALWRATRGLFSGYLNEDFLLEFREAWGVKEGQLCNRA